VISWRNEICPNLKPDLQTISKGSCVASRRRIQVIRPVRSANDVMVYGMRSLVQSAGLLRAMTVTRLKIRYRYSLLGWFWALLQPLTLMVLYSLIFAHFTHYSTESLPYLLFVFAGLTPWAFCSTSISTAVAGMLTYRPLMATVYFPREIVPISFVGASLIDLGIAFVVLLMMMFYYSVPIAATALLAIPILVVLAVLVIAICLFVSSIQIRIRDINVALPLVLQVLVFTTPIVYPASAVPPTLERLYWLNPFALLVQSFREAVVGGAVPPLGDLLYCTVVAVACLIISYLVFKKIEPTIVDDM
jgi:lipopolysaccharide transport system permease protein